MMAFLKKIVTLLLMPFSWLYDLVTSLRNKMFDTGMLKCTSFDIPVISIGNITVGGTGKTPHVEYLAGLLNSRFKVAVLSRGYKRKSEGFVFADDKSTPETLGDELYQIKQKFPGIIASADADRVNGISQILSKCKSIDVILLDDAFQHRKVKPGLSILLIDYNRPIFKDFLLPAGRLRESWHNAKRADIIIISKSPSEISVFERENFIKQLKPSVKQAIFFSYLEYGNFVPLFLSNDKVLTSKEIAADNYEILLVSGIANPEPLIKHIQSVSPTIHLLRFSDHHNFTKKDIEKICIHYKSLNSKKKIIVTTEKDAVKLTNSPYFPEEIKNFIYFIPIKVKFNQQDMGQFNHQLYSYVRKNQ